MGLGAAIRDWWVCNRAAREYESLGREGRRALARDTGLPESTLGEIISSGSGAGEELPYLLEAICLDAADLKRTHPDVMRDMQITCSICAAAKQCRRDLRQGVSRVTFHRYCPNGDTIAALEKGILWRSFAVPNKSTPLAKLSV